MVDPISTASGPTKPEETTAKPPTPAPAPAKSPVASVPQATKMAKKPPEDLCTGIPMHVGSPKHCPKCPDSEAAKTFHRANPGESGLVGFTKNTGGN